MTELEMCGSTLGADRKCRRCWGSLRRTGVRAEEPDRRWCTCRKQITGRVSSVHASRAHIAYLDGRTPGLYYSEFR